MATASGSLSLACLLRRCVLACGITILLGIFACAIYIHGLTQIADLDFMMAREGTNTTTLVNSAHTTSQEIPLNESFVIPPPHDTTSGTTLSTSLTSLPLAVASPAANNLGNTFEQASEIEKKHTLDNGGQAKGGAASHLETSQMENMFSTSATSPLSIIECEWAKQFLHTASSLPKEGAMMLHDHVIRLSVWASQTAPELSNMREAYPAVSENVLLKHAMDVFCLRCKPFMPVSLDVPNLHYQFVHGMTQCIREHEKQILYNISEGKAIHGIPGLKMPCRESVVSGDLLLERNALKLDFRELGPHQSKEVECAAEIPIVPAMRLPMMFSALHDLRTHCEFTTPGLTQWQPWCRSLEYLFAKQKKKTENAKDASWVQDLMKAGVVDPAAAAGGVVWPRTFSLDQDDTPYLGMFRVRNAAYLLGDAVVTCTCDTWADCHTIDRGSSACRNTWYGSAWHDPSVDRKIVNRINMESAMGETQHQAKSNKHTKVDGRWTHELSDAAHVCCDTVIQSASNAHVCRKVELSLTCPLLTHADRKSKIIKRYDECLQEELGLSKSSHWLAKKSKSPEWQTTLSRTLCSCCRQERSRARTKRFMAKPQDKRVCSAITCPTSPPTFDTVLHISHPWAGVYFHTLYEIFPTVLAFREYLAQNENVMIRAGAQLHKYVGESTKRLLNGMKITESRISNTSFGFAKELLAARLMPASSFQLPPAQLYVAHRAVLCTSAVEDNTIGQLVIDGSTYQSVWDLALSDPKACRRFGFDKISGNCSVFRNLDPASAGNGVLKVLLAEHGPGTRGGREWEQGKPFVYEAIAKLPVLLPPHLRPKAIVVADVVIGRVSDEVQARTYSEAHIVLGAQGSQLAKCICMQPGSYFGVIHQHHHDDPFLWTMASPFGVQYWTLISAKHKGKPKSMYGPHPFGAAEGASLRVFMEKALVGAATLLVH